MTSIGGQALLEGIMMKGPHKTVMATRLPDKTIDIEELPENTRGINLSPSDGR